MDVKLEQAANIIKDGGVIICPTEGVYGISALAQNDKALARIIKIKERSLNKGLIVVSHSIESLEPLIDFKKLDNDAMSLLCDKWPGHCTFILPTKDNLSDLLTGGRDTLAVRICAFPLLRELCRLVGGPIVSTSANISGSDPLKSIEELKATFECKVDFILERGCQGLSKPSTIIDAITGQILRP